MADRWFSDEELREMARPTMDRAIEAIDAGDLDGAKALCEAMKHEWRFLHDMMVDSIAASLTWIKENCGEQAVGESQTLGDGALLEAQRGGDRQARAQGDRAAARRDVAGALVQRHRAAAGRLRDRGGRREGHLPDEPVRLGQRLWRMGRYEGEDGHAVMEGEHDWAYNRSGFPIYCTHCSFMNEIAVDPVDRLPGLPERPAGRLRSRSLHVVLVQGPGRHPGPPLGALWARAASDALSPAGRRVIVTGARGGIGRATVALLTSAGCSVAGCDVEDFDVRDRDAVDAGVAALVERLGGCDAIVANAGVVDTIHRAERFTVDELAEGHRHEPDRRRSTSSAPRSRRCASPATAAWSSSRPRRPRPGCPARSPTRPRRPGLVGMAADAGRRVGRARHPGNVVMPGLIGTPKVLALPERIQRGDDGRRCRWAGSASRPSWRRRWRSCSRRARRTSRAPLSAWTEATA